MFIKKPLKKTLHPLILCKSSLDILWWKEYLAICDYHLGTAEIVPSIKIHDMKKYTVLWKCCFECSHCRVCLLSERKTEWKQKNLLKCLDLNLACCLYFFRVLLLFSKPLGTWSLLWMQSMPTTTPEKWCWSWFVSFRVLMKKWRRLCWRLVWASTLRRSLKITIIISVIARKIHLLCLDLNLTVV